MSIVEDEIIGSHTEDESTGSSDDNTDEVLALFGIEKEEDEEKSFNDKTPAKEEVKTDNPEPRMIKVKHNKEEVDADVSDDKLPELVQRSLALDKERERKTELEKTLERVAKLEGVSVSDYLANLDKKEAEAVEKEKTAYDDLRKELREQAEDAGLDPDKVQQYLDNHPLMKQAQQAITERDTFKAERESQSIQQTVQTQWQELYNAFPDIVEDSQAFDNNESPKFYTDEMKSLVEQGYKPLHAYKLAHMDTIQAQTKTKTQQRMIKEQHLGLRSQVESHSANDNEPQVPSDLANAFEAFGLPKESAKKYVK